MDEDFKKIKEEVEKIKDLDREFFISLEKLDRSDLATLCYFMFDYLDTEDQIQFLAKAKYLISKKGDKLKKII